VLINLVQRQSVQLHLSHKQPTSKHTDKGTYQQTQESNLVHFSLKKWRLVAIF